MHNIGIILAAGKGARFSDEVTPKQFHKLYRSSDVVEHTISKFQLLPLKYIVLVLNEPFIQDNKLIAKYRKASKKDLVIVRGGNTRALSVMNAINKIREIYQIKHVKNTEEKLSKLIVAIHDSVRPLFNHKSVNTWLQYLASNSEYDAIEPILPIVDAIRLHSGEESSRKREEYYTIQTPQIFKFPVIENVYQKLNEMPDEAKIDDIGLLYYFNKHHKTNYKILKVEGELNNFKITFPEQLEKARKHIATEEYTKHYSKNYNVFRVGTGIDVHRLKKSEKYETISIGGTMLKCMYKIIAHSDGDVVLHAITDAILGAIGETDIGTKFLNDDVKWKNAKSEIFVQHAVTLMKKKRYNISNIDISIIADHPQIQSHVKDMKKHIARLTFISQNDVAIKATTTENTGIFTEDAIYAHCTLLLHRK
ncbi:2-C-methyl-D-erythritol 2,4-cyclodiphosphate synthase [Candidatus Fokinia crypta]|uniref:2-C-methyl-D-erythritol 2,4-cyclodiphosphate synthase n=1 Tax=Candidatus Fokinia crypta TaxID=1920990 RepID=A0ABZ0UNH8_9RICK|nr:2-C-methyl-D-erythritol 2,4-cyclodiphosphate synthase [Candidatus Fokinia cryptica]WPX97674.1 2-C-methyl-D-erythritol 2,4-cyclodiphosphate synthase [Candidatus Fokinia cryptica]